MRFDAVELRSLELPLVRPFRTSFGTETVREALVVRVLGDDGEGYGECVAGSEPLYSSEFVASSWLVMRDHLVPALLAAGSTRADSVKDVLAGFSGHRMAKAALEMAVLDAELRSRCESLQELLGGTGESVTPGVSVGITTDVVELLDVVGRYLEEGYQRVKLKIEPGFDLEPVAAVRQLVGDGFMLQVDANTAYTRSDFDLLARLDEFGLLLLEQPLDEEDILGHAELARRLATPICLDESVLSVRSAATAIELGACSVVNIKAGRVGGYLEARRVHDLCRGAGVPVWCGGMLETGLGRAANLALATLPGFALPGDISATSRYFHEDITERFELVGGRIGVPKGPGLGVTVDVGTLERLTRRHEIVHARQAG
ncbi:MAG: o-succinylbenzoate synthase [Actinomycetota bacterium]|nr:o-succinylbenzoate synthase [Actinomycetota bacterium]